MILDAQNISCSRGTRPILENLSFSVKKGDCIILRGPNGIGKTTLLRALAGLGEISQGTLSITTEEIVYAGHSDAVKSALSVEENLRFWAQLYTSNIDDCLERLNLSSLRDRLAGRLSAGQRRRLGLARLLLSSAELWILDEPTNSLDKEMTETFQTLIEDHLSQGGGAILSTHLDLPMASARNLDLSDFAARQNNTSSPFLEGSWT